MAVHLFRRDRPFDQLADDDWKTADLIWRRSGHRKTEKLKVHEFIALLMFELWERIARVHREGGLTSILSKSVRHAFGQLTPRAWLMGVSFVVYWRLRYGVPLRAGARCALSEDWMGGERSVVHDLLVRLRPDDVFYDVGAHIGLYTTIVASVLPPDQVVAFEPYDEFAVELERNLRELGLAATVVRAGIGPTDTQQEYDPVHRAAGAEGSNPTNGPTVEETNADAQVKTGDLPQPTIVKIDVAGAENRVLQGMEDSLADPACRLVFCEIHPPARHRPSITDFGGSVSDVFRFFLDRDFHVDVLSTPRTSEIFIRAERG